MPKFNRARLRNLHAALAPLMALPLIITLITGMAFQVALSTGNAGDFIWIINIHHGKFGPVDLTLIYPFLNALGLLTLVITGVVMWSQRPKRRKATGT
ncbi:MAG: PepSY domain-containing protein [Cyanobacteria bacterium P01_H01_bin.121]